MQAYANVVEVFSSIQGEGLYVGCRQVFVRLAGCNLACAYCDTPASQNYTGDAKVEQHAGCRDFISMSNPVPIPAMVENIKQLLRGPHHSVSFTGGEPLCQWQVIAAVAPQLNIPIYLETNGTLFTELEHILPYVDIISMDIKLPSAGQKPCWDDHQNFLKIAREKALFVKIVITADTNQTEFDRAIQLVRQAEPSIPVILQPVTPNNECKAPLPETMLRFQARALEQLKDVRVIPQTHKIMGQL